MPPPLAESLFAQHLIECPGNALREFSRCRQCRSDVCILGLLRARAPPTALRQAGIGSRHCNVVCP